MGHTRHLQGLLIVLVLAGLVGLYLWQNNQPAVTVAVPAATVTLADVPPADWQVALETQLAVAATPFTTPDLAMSPYVPPTLPPTVTEAVIFQPVEVKGTPWPTVTLRPTEPPAEIEGPTPVPSPTGVLLPETPEELGFAPPPEQVPLSPHANDHFWLMRPVDASANSASLFYYTYPRWRGGDSGVCW